jgi:Protein of unknown function (DUF559)
MAGTPSVDQLVEENIRSFFEEQRSDINAFLKRCESPLEKLLGSAFLRGCQDQRTFFEGCPVGASFNAGLMGFLAGAQNVYFTITPNAEITTERGKFRPDFLFQVYEPDTGIYGRVVFLFGVEIDGHDFHEKTREQAQRDKSRDRVLLRAGIRLLRFTGSEVFHSLDEVLNEIGDFIATEAERIGLFRQFITGEDWERNMVFPELPEIDGRK